MTPERWARIKEIFRPALEMPETERRVFLDEACAADASLRDEVERLLAKEDAPSLVSPAAELLRQAAAPTLIAGRMLGHYRVEEKLGEGGMGVVYKARDEHLQREVAIKVLPAGTLGDEAARKLFRKEALALSRLSHPNIATIHDFDTLQDLDFLVMEYIPGITLSEKLATGPLPEKEVLRLGMQLGEGLAAAHEYGVVHRDLKPSNLQLTGNGWLKILDFGLAKLPRSVAESAATESFSETQTMAGTLPYMAPEQLLGGETDARTDIHAAGCVLYEMATGKRPFADVERSQLIAAILRSSPLPPTALNPRSSPELERIIGKCLEKEPEDRYQSAKELVIDLRRLQTGVVSAVQPAARPARWSSAKSVGLGLGILASVIVLLIALNVGKLRERVLGGTDAPRIRSLAVLPVKNLSGDPSQEFFADGMTDALIAGLAQIKAFKKVISRTSVMQYKDAKKSLPQIARELGVDGIVEASVMRSGGRVRITAQLIEARQDRHLWANNYERDMTDVLALQSELVRAIAGEIQVQVSPQESERLKTARRVDPEVYDATLKGKATLEYATREGELHKAIELFQKAIDRDPTYAPAWAGLGEALWCLASSGWEFVAPAEVRDKAIAAAEKALELDGTLPDAHKARAVIAFDGEWDVAKAQRHFDRALELRPGYAAAHNLYGQMLASPLLRFDEARRHYDRARELDPLSPWNDINLVGWWTYQEQPERAREEGERARRRNPTLWIIRWQIGFAQLILGQPSQAVPEFDAALELLRPERPAAVLAPLGLAYGLAGRRVDALKILAEMEHASQKRYTSPFYLAVVYSGLGRMDEAFRLLDRALEQRTPWLVSWCVPYDPNSVALRRDPRWKPFIDRLRRLVRLPPGTLNPYS
jgi:eukaryotic-like serine/threonine-protein kinase